MTTGIVIFARMDSQRLPGKVLKPLAGSAILGWTIERCRLAAPDLPIGLATSDRLLDDPVAAFAEAAGLAVFRGDAADVLGRALAAARTFGLDTLVRISADSPFIAPELVAQVIGCHAAERPDLTTNVFPRTYPPGISAEAISLPALERLADLTRDPADREHVTRFAYANPDQFRIVNVTAPVPYQDLHLAVDSATDFARAAWIAERLPDPAASLDEIVTLARRYDAEAQAGKALINE